MYSLRQDKLDRRESLYLTGTLVCESALSEGAQVEAQVGCELLRDFDKAVKGAAGAVDAGLWGSHVGETGDAFADRAEHGATGGRG